MLYARADCRFHNQAVIESLSDKFDNVYRDRSVRPVSGWPFGPNALAIDLFRKIKSWYSSGQFPYTGVLLVEADCVPLRAGWIDEIRNEWLSSKALALGHWDGSGKNMKPPASHMNGNMVIHPELLNKIDGINSTEIPTWGWDMQYWDVICRYASPSRLIYSDYRLNTKKNPLTNCCKLWDHKEHTHPENPLYGEKLFPCWIHGTKGTLAQECVRKKLLENT